MSIANEPSLITATAPPIVPTTIQQINPNALPAEFKSDPGKTDAENAVAKAAFDAEQAKLKEAPKVEPTPEEKAKLEAETKNKVSPDNPFKPEELKLPDGFVIDETASKGFVELVNKHGIPRDGVAELVKLQSDLMKAASERGDAQRDELWNSWRNEVMADKEIGGDKLTQTQAGIGHLLTKYGDAKTRAAFDLTGAGNHPDIIKFLAKMTADLTEPGTRPPPSHTTSEKSLADKMYPNQGKAA